MPPFDTYILMAVKGRMNKFAQDYYYKILTGKMLSADVFMCRYSGTFTAEEVTHWMPLPEPPKE
jgi:hypothetical protein